MGLEISFSFRTLALFKYWRRILYKSKYKWDCETELTYMSL